MSEMGGNEEDYWAARDGRLTAQYLRDKNRK
jgi:hypothetical protein